jgi:hypothetical protein
MWQETDVIYFKELFQHFPGCAEHFGKNLGITALNLPSTKQSDNHPNSVSIIDLSKQRKRERESNVKNAGKKMKNIIGQIIHERTLSSQF